MHVISSITGADAVLAVLAIGAALFMLRAILCADQSGREQLFRSDERRIRPLAFLMRMLLLSIGAGFIYALAGGYSLDARKRYLIVPLIMLTAAAAAWLIRGPKRARAFWPRGRSIAKCAALGIFLLFMSAIEAQADKRVALIIGNANYQNTSSLANSANDAADLAAALTDVGFTVILEQNLDKRGMEMAIGRFARLAQDADGVLLFFAGHGIQYRGQNYLVPVDAKIEDEFSLNFELTRLDDVLSALDRARGVKILILDACRDNPLVDRFTQRAASRDPVATRGLTRIDPGRGMIVAYSTQPNQVAVDGTGRNSPFTAALIKQISEPGLEVGALFRRVAADVSCETGGRQLPEISVSLVGEFFLNTRETDLQAWAKVRDSSDPEPLREFLANHSKSLLVPDARRRLAALELAKSEREQRERELRERAQAERVQAEHQAQEQAERERVAAERQQRERAEQGRLQQQRLALEAAEQQRLAAEQQQREQADRERIEQLARQLIAREFAQREEAAKAEEERARLAREKAAQPAPAASPNAQITLLTPPTEIPSPATSAPIAPLLAGTSLIAEIEKELKRVGCYGGSTYNTWGNAEVASSVRKFARYAKLSAPSAEPTTELLTAIRGASDRVCPLECGAREVERNGRCIARSCPSGSLLNSKGRCEKREREKAVARRDELPSGPRPEGRAAPAANQARFERCLAQRSQFRGGAARGGGGGHRGFMRGCMAGGG